MPASTIALAPTRTSRASGSSSLTRTGKRCATCTQFTERCTIGSERGKLMRSLSAIPAPMPTTLPVIARPRSIIE